MDKENKSNKEFIPSYLRDKNSNIEKKEVKKIDKKKIIIFISILFIVLIAITILTLLIQNKKYEKYVAYEESMRRYGFDKVYDNLSSRTQDKVTKSEAVKMVISAVYNTSDIEGLATTPKEEYSNSMWVEFGTRLGIITVTDVNSENADEYATYSDVIRFFSNAKVNVLKLNLDTEDKGIVRDINNYNMDEKFGILDMVNNKIINENVKKVDARKKVFKGQVNEIIKNFVEKYNTITIGNEKLNISEEKIPQNANEYPYTVISVDKSVYEFDFSGKDNPNFKSPVEVFPEQKEYYYQIKNNTENYYNILLNIDYSNIDEKKLKENLEKYLLFNLDKKVIESYVKYVKDNNIKITGNAKVQIPTIYYDGTYYRVRVKLEFKIESSDTLYDLLLGDENVEYSDDEYTIYIDTYMSNSYNNKTLYNVFKPLSDMYIKSQNANIKLEGE